jgi:hypothetical protein
MGALRPRNGEEKVSRGAPKHEELSSTAEAQEWEHRRGFVQSTEAQEPRNIAKAKEWDRGAVTLLVITSNIL